MKKGRRLAETNARIGRYFARYQWQAYISASKNFWQKSQAETAYRKLQMFAIATTVPCDRKLMLAVDEEIERIIRPQDGRRRFHSQAAFASGFLVERVKAVLRRATPKEGAALKYAPSNAACYAWIRSVIPAPGRTSPSPDHRILIMQALATW
jgi:hypothetical protein